MSETQGRRRGTSWATYAAAAALLGIGLSVGWAAGSAGGETTDHGGGGYPPASPGPSGAHPSPMVFGASLVAYNSCDALGDAIRQRARAIVGPYGFGSNGAGIRFGLAEDARASGPSVPSAALQAGGPTSTSKGAAAAPLTHSVTNTQVAGVDEPDVVKTDGRVMVSIDGQQVHVVDVRTPKLRSTVTLPHPGSELLMAGDRVVVLSGSTDQGGGGIVPGGFRYNYYSGSSTTTATVLDVSDPDHPTVERSWTFDASEVAARVVNGSIRLVLSSAPPTASWATPRDSTPAETQAGRPPINQSIVDALPLDSWLPHWSVADSTGQSHRVSACDAVAVPAKATSAGMVSVLTLDPASDKPGAGTSVFGSGDVAYAEGTHLFISDGGTYPTPVLTETQPFNPNSAKPTVHLLEFDLTNPAQAQFLASGSVPGVLHDSYALSEYRDQLRVTTTTTAANGTSVTGIAVFERSGEVLKQIGSLSGLGAGEQVYAVRYLGDRGYVVTFQQVDPLHVVDLSNPAHPVLRGTVELPGYSALLIPLPGDRLLGVGRSVQSFGSSGSCIAGSTLPCKDTQIVEPNGLQLALFDVKDAAHPRLLDRKVVAGDSAGGGSDTHGITADPAGGFFVMPLTNSLLGIRVTNTLTLTDAAAPQPYSLQEYRAVFAGQRVFQLTDRGVAVRARDGLKQTGWVRF